MLAPLVPGCRDRDFAGGETFRLCHTLFASLLLATRGRPVQVWLGAAAAFTVHVAIALTAGVALFALVAPPLP